MVNRYVLKLITTHKEWKIKFGTVVKDKGVFSIMYGTNMVRKQNGIFGKVSQTRIFSEFPLLENQV